MNATQKDDETDDQVDFGYRRVEPREKPALVRALFDRVSGRYDLMNDLMSGGIHRLWKREMIAWLRPRAGQTLLDVAGGTGDIAFRFLDAVGGDGSAIVCDASPGMLEAGQTRAWNAGRMSGLGWLGGDAERLPLASASVDAYTIAFGIRNVTHIERALEEAHRVLRPGGRFLCLEFSPEQSPGLDKLYEIYSFTLIPVLGRLVARDEAAYRYLVESIRRFPAPERFAGMIGEAGFGAVRCRRLSGGIAALHSAWRT